MTNNGPSKRGPRVSGKEQYGGMVDFDMSFTPSVVICGTAGAVLGAILAMRGTTEIPMVVATVIVFACFRASSASSCLDINLADTRTPERNLSVACLQRSLPRVGGGAQASTYDEEPRGGTMAFKYSAFVAFIAIPAVFIVGCDGWRRRMGSPNVPGQPGYKEPPKVDEVHAPRPAQDPKLGGYHPKRATETGPGSSR